MMKVTSSFFLAILSLAVAGHATADLVAHYEFENDARDSSGNRLPGSFVGVTSIADTNVTCIDFIVVCSEPYGGLYYGFLR